MPASNSVSSLAPTPSRRDFLRTAGLVTAGFLGLRKFASHPVFADTASAAGGVGFGPLRRDPAGILDLPAGFRYTMFSATGEEMADGLLVPGMHDGMAAFPGPDGTTLLVRNHEIESHWLHYSPFGRDAERLDRIPRHKVYDYGHGVQPNLGGTTTLVFDTRTQTMQRHFLSLAGTVRNCAGGPTPWGTWITCEEVNREPEPHAEKPHGYNFEVAPSAEPGLVEPVPLKAMGRFRHEAVAVDPATGIVYQTEDHGDGLIYRFIPQERGRLAAGGRLQALAFVDEAIRDTRNWEGSPPFPVGRALPVRWIDVDDIDSPLDDLRRRGHAAGAALFARNEGMWYGNDSIYWAATSGGPKALGQVFRYWPSEYEATPRETEAPGRLELFVEPNDFALLNNADNLCVAPWGDLILCEDAKAVCRLVGVTPRGELYVLASHPVFDRELAGACFSPDGSTLFVNVQQPGYTLAIVGPWPRG